MSQDDKYLGGILTPVEFEQFEAARTNQKPFRATGKSDRFSDYFSLADFDRLVNQTGIWTPERLEVHLDTKKVPPQSLFSQLPLYNGSRFKLEAAALQKLIDRGASIVLNGIEEMTDGLKSLRYFIADYSGGKVEGNLYYSQPGHQAFSIHFDVHEVFAFQITGEKRWRIYQQAHRFPINHLAFLAGDPAKHEAAKGPVSMEVVLRPGDFVYLPAGYYHQAICIDSTSIHLSYSVVEMIGLDIVSEIFDSGVLDEFFRTPVRRTNGGGDLSVADYMTLLVVNIERLTTSENFTRNIEAKLQSFPYSTGRVSIKR